MAVKTTRTATEEQLPTREEAEAAFALALDARQERVRAALNKLASDPPQVLILEGGSVAERFSVALWARRPPQLPGRAAALPALPGLPPDRREFVSRPVCAGRREGSIKIETVRELRTILGEAPRGDGKRVVILAEAQSLGVEAANALLKSLEEPRPGVCFLLLAPQRERLLPTLVSRGWVVTLAWPEAGTPSTPELFQWEEALAEFMASGRGARQDVRQGCRRCGAGPPDHALRPEGTGRSPRRAGWRASWTASCHPPRSRPSPCQRSAGAMPGIAGLYGQPPAGPQLAGHAAAHRLSSRPAARAEANRLTDMRLTL